MGGTIKCNCCNQDEKRNEVKFGNKQYEFKIMASFNFINLFNLFT